MIKIIIISLWKDVTTYESYSLFQILSLAALGHIISQFQFFTFITTGTATEDLKDGIHISTRLN